MSSLKSFALVTLTVFSLCFSGVANADPACDATFMTAMKQKAWMEAQREIMIAQSIIAKPDSVFALGCFDSFWQSYSPSIRFSYGNRWLPGPQISSYLAAAFSHAYGGGHNPNVGGTNSTVNPGCSAMLNLWNDARCQNLDIAKIQTLTETSEEAGDAQLRGSFPLACTNPGAWDVPLENFRVKLPNQSVGAEFNDMILFITVTAPLSQTPSGTCAAGIPTGVTMTNDVEEIVCPNPGCTPNGSGQCCRFSNGSFSGCT